MLKEKIDTRFLVLAGIVILAVISRILPHIPNATPIAAMALMSGAYFRDKKVAFILPFIAMFISDIFVGFHQSMIFVYLSFAITVLLGYNLRNSVSPVKVIGFSILSSILFFVITNFGSWVSISENQNLYPHTLKGLFACFAAAIPFFRNTLLGDLLYSGILFGGFELVKRYRPEFSVELT